MNLADRLFAQNAGVYSEDPRAEKPGTPMGHALVACTGDDDPEAPQPNEQAEYARFLARKWNALAGVKVDHKADGSWLRIECGPQSACLNLATLGDVSHFHGPIVTKAINLLLIQIGRELGAA
jgi:hypothetical protein